MSPLDIALIAVLIPAGILAATFATVRSLVRHACEEHDRWLFDTYVHRPAEVESWLVRGALDHLRHALICEGAVIDDGKHPDRVRGVFEDGNLGGIATPSDLKPLKASAV